MALFDRQPVAAVAAAVVADVGFRDPANIRRVRELLSWPRASGAPIIAILRDNSHQERVQATALGATVLLPATASDLDLAAALAPAVRYEHPCASAAATLSPAQNIEQASLQFGMLFSAAVRGEAPTNRHIEATTKCVMTAIGEGGIRRWLEIIWRHDDATYQHCLLVTGLAAEFARSLRFYGRRPDAAYQRRPAARHRQGQNPARDLEQAGSVDRERTDRYPHPCADRL